ncbi:MAG: peptide MFS transporter [Pseudomonadota bacterium]|nr:peptide MFS transporter [Pseudomonadota bacterium]
MTPRGAAPLRSEGTWLSHPKGLFVLFLTEMWERMSYYGMRSLLVLYMVNHLFVRPDAGAEVLGFNALRHSLETAFGVLTPQALSSQIYGLYTGFVYFTPFFGGMLADRLLGRRKAVVVGAVLMAIGHFLMASEAMFFVALMFLILGNGCFKPNISTQVGGLYAEGDPRRDRAFSIFYVGVNLGAFLAPLVCGTLGQRIGWHYGFAAAGVGMVLGLIVYLFNQDKLPVEPAPTSSATTPIAGVAAFIVAIPLGILALLWLLTLPALVPISLAVLVLASTLVWMIRLPRGDRPRVMAICAACFVTAAFWAVYEQQGNTLQLWADQSTRWPTILGFTIPSTWYQAFNPFMIWIIVPLLNLLWGWQAGRGREPSSLAKMAIGCIVLGAGFIVMIVAATDMAPGPRNSVLWLVASTAIFTIGEIYLSPVGLSFVSKVAPARMVSMMMGVWYLSNFVGNYMTGYLGTFYERMPHAQFFVLMACIGGVAGLALFAMNRPLDRIVGAHDRHAGASASAGAAAAAEGARG